MKAYHNLLQTILDTGNDRGDRTGTGTKSCFGLQFRHNLQEGFPLLTTKKLPWRAIVVELLWFLRGDTNIKYLLENGVHIWTADAYRHYINQFADKEAKRASYSIEDYKEDMKDPHFARTWGDLGPVYGAQWKAWPNYEYTNAADYSTWEYKPIDQIQNVIESIRKDPEGRRHIVTAWNPSEIASMALPPCHCLFQFYVADGKLSCHLYQRSADTFLGVPFNIASYALLTHIMANQCNLGIGELIITFGDIHIYNNHIEQVKEQLRRAPRQLPRLEYFEKKSLESYSFEDFYLEGYDPYPAIKGELSVGT